MELSLASQDIIMFQEGDPTHSVLPTSSVLTTLECSSQVKENAVGPIKGFLFGEQPVCLCIVNFHGVYSYSLCNWLLSEWRLYSFLFSHGVRNVQDTCPCLPYCAKLFCDESCIERTKNGRRCVCSQLSRCLSVGFLKSC